MPTAEWLAEQSEQRFHLRAVASRMLRSASGTDDAAPRLISRTVFTGNQRCVDMSSDGLLRGPSGVLPVVSGADHVASTMLLPVGDRRRLWTRMF
jgi:hypothetical protein